MSEERLIIEMKFVQTDKASTEKVFDDVEKKAGKAGKGAGKKFKKGFGNALKGLKKNIAGIVAAFAAFRVVTAQVGKGVTEVRNFSRAIAEVNSILPETTRLTQDSIDKFKEFSGAFATTTTKQAEAFYTIVSAGVKGVTTQIDTLNISNKAATAGLVDVDVAAKALVSSVNAYAASGLTATEASDKLFIAVREGQTTFGELASTIGTVAPVAASAGLSFGELVGTISGVTKAGIRTDIAMTGVRSLLSSLIKVTPAAAAEAKRLGLEFGTQAVKGGKFVEFLGKLKKATGGSEVAIGKLFPNIRAMGPVLQVINGDFEDFVRIQGEVEKSLGATSKAAEIIKESLDFKLRQATANFALLRQELTNFFTPALSSAAEKFTRFLQLINSSSSPTVKMTAKMSILREQLKEFSAENANATFSSYKGHVVTFGDKVTETTNKLNVMAAKILQIRNQKLFDESLFGQITVAKSELYNLNQRMKLVVGGFADLQNASQMELTGDISAKEREIASLEAAMAKLGQTAKDVANPPDAATWNPFPIAGNILEYWDRITIGLEKMSNKNEKANKRLIAQSKAMASVMKNSLAKGISGGIQNIVNSIAKGEDAFANFSKFFLATIGDMAIKLGETLILSGVGMAALSALGPAQAIAAGAGLVALGTIIKNAAGGAGGNAGGGGGGGGPLIEDGGAAEIDDEDIERQTSSTVNITVEGSLVQQEELGAFVSSVISESNEKNGNVILNPRFA